MSQEDLKASIQAAAPDGKIACAAAFRLAEELGLSAATWESCSTLSR